MSEQQKQTPSVAPEEQETSPVEQENTPAEDKGEEFVTLSKKEAEDLQALKARQAELTKRELAVKQREKRLSSKKIRKSKPQFTFEEPEPEDEPTETEQELAIEREVMKVEKGVLQMVKSGKYDELLNRDKTLKEQLLENPLGLSIFARENPRDAEDALDKIEDILLAKAEALSSQEPKKEKIEEKEKPAEVKAGPTNPPAQEKPEPENSSVKTEEEVANGFMSRLLGK